jgi:hypothetical protein
MSKLTRHAKKLQNSERIPELERLGDAADRHATYLYLMHLDPSHFLHMKNASREHLGFNHHYFEYPQIILFQHQDYPVLERLANPVVGHHDIVHALEADNVQGGNMWKSIKRVAHKAAKIYGTINSGVHAAASFASKLPLPPKFQVMADALKTGTELHGKIADVVANATV